MLIREGMMKLEETMLPQDITLHCGSSNVAKCFLLKIQDLSKLYDSEKKCIKVAMNSQSQALFCFFTEMFCWLKWAVFCSSCRKANVLCENLFRSFWLTNKDKLEFRTLVGNLDVSALWIFLLLLKRLEMGDRGCVRDRLKEGMWRHSAQSNSSIQADLKKSAFAGGAYVKALCVVSWDDAWCYCDILRNSKVKSWSGEVEEMICGIIHFKVVFAYYNKRYICKLKKT